MEKTPQDIFKEVLEELGFAGYKPDQMTNSDYWLCTCTAMEKYAKYIELETLEKVNGVQAKEATAVVPYDMTRFSDKKPPVDETVLFVWWHGNGWQTSQKTLGFIDAENVLHLDFTPAGGKKPSFWCFLKME